MGFRRIVGNCDWSNVAMRHRMKGRKFGRNPKHQRALLRSLASALFLTERDAEFDPNPPKVKGRIITTIDKAKEVRPLVEKCITIARKGLAAEEAAGKFGTKAERGSSEWKAWRESPKWNEWNQAVAPARGGSPPLLDAAGRQGRRSRLVRRSGAAIHRPSRRLHADRSPGEAAIGRRRHASHSRVCRRSRSRRPAEPEAGV